MTLHRPGRPGDLPPPELLWARWALVAVLEANTEAEGRGVHRTGHWLSGTALQLDDAGCTWWTLSRRGEGRYVLYGEDESSAVKWHEPAVDMLAGAPDRLPYEKLRDLLQGWELGCVYWYENGTWARAPYPEGLSDDGLDCGMSRFVDRAEVSAYWPTPTCRWKASRHRTSSTPRRPTACLPGPWTPSAPPIPPATSRRCAAPSTCPASRRRCSPAEPSGMDNVVPWTRRHSPSRSS
ncbi:hypothetical protein [Streptomyces sp. NPDC091259]|uniref:hypothetical protein n=1 Tax=Streptomyces sp. NPDC091259 TaxID=3365976 RepID=UPI00380CC334